MTPGPDTARRCSVAEFIAPIERVYPPETAESWDRVGLAVGDPDAGVGSVLLSVDVTDAVLAEAIELDAQLIISHHPLLLHGIHEVRLDQPKGRLVSELISNRVALYTAHTNADIGPGGTVDTLATVLALSDVRPLVPVPIRSLDKITTFVPDDHAESVLAALAGAGAGAIGDYDRCAFSTSGTGTFRPLPGADPFLGRVGKIERVAETRLEMIMDRADRRAVESALLSTHPYQTPAYDIVELVPLGDRTGLGRVGTVTRSGGSAETDPLTVGDFARRVAERVPCRTGGVRVSGDLDRLVRRVAVQAGAGDDLLDRARQAGVDLYLTSDLRHHPASEAVAWKNAPALIDIPHAAAEALWLPRLAELVGSATHPESGSAPKITVSRTITGPWQHYF